MESSRAEGKRASRYKDEDEDDDEEEEEEDEEAGYGDDIRKKRSAVTNSKRGSKGSSSMPPSCQVESCLNRDLSYAKPYHRRHKVCEYHAKAPAVLMAGMQQRFCQQCSRFRNPNPLGISKFCGSDYFTCLFS